MILVNALRNVAKTFICFTLVFVPILANAEYSIPWQNIELVIRGDYFRASVIAYADFSQYLNKQKKDSNMMQIDNYNIEISVGDSRYYIWFHPRLSKKFPGGFGGDASYEIDSKTFEILEKQFGK